MSMSPIAMTIAVRTALVPKCHATTGRGEWSDPRGRPPGTEKYAKINSIGCACQKLNSASKNPKQFSELRTYFLKNLPACRLAQVRLLLGPVVKSERFYAPDNHMSQKGVLGQLISSHRKRKHAA